MTDLEGRELDEALAGAWGWVKDDFGFHWRNGEEVDDIPEYHASLDALLRDIEPVCRERARFRFGNCSPGTTGDWEAFIEWEDNEGGIDYFFGPTAATALARAFLAVLTR